MHNVFIQWINKQVVKASPLEKQAVFLIVEPFLNLYNVS